MSVREIEVLLDEANIPSGSVTARIKALLEAYKYCDCDVTYCMVAHEEALESGQKLFNCHKCGIMQCVL